MLAFGRLRHELTPRGGHRHPDRPRRRRGGGDPRPQGRVAGAVVGRGLRAPSGPRRPVAVRGRGLRLHLAPRLQPFHRGTRPRDAGGRVGGGPHPLRDTSVPAGLAAPRVPRAPYPSAPRLLHGLRDAGPAAVLGPSGGLVDGLHHRPGVQRAGHRSACWPRWCFRARRGLGHRLNHAGLALGVAWLAFTVVAKAHVDRVASDSLPPGVTRVFTTPTPLNAVLWRVVAMTGGRAVSGRLLLAAGRGAPGFVHEPAGRPRAARTASRRSGGGAPRVVLQGVLQRTGTRERRDRDLRSSDGTGGAARVLVRGGPPRRGGHRARAGPPAPGPGGPARNVGRPGGADSRPLGGRRPASCPVERRTTDACIPARAERHPIPDG